MVNGTDPSLRPLLVLSHYDVVPAEDETSARRTYSPSAGIVVQRGVSLVVMGLGL